MQPDCKDKEASDIEDQKRDTSTLKCEDVNC